MQGGVPQDELGCNTLCAKSKGTIKCVPFCPTYPTWKVVLFRN